MIEQERNIVPLEREYIMTGYDINTGERTQIRITARSNKQAKLAAMEFITSPKVLKKGSYHGPTENTFRSNGVSVDGSGEV